MIYGLLILLKLNSFSLYLIKVLVYDVLEIKSTGPSQQLVEAALF